ncbi:class I SAM-dependent RNA methyltransferase [Fodinicola feengrottensis]|uniref:hypothetical protein n=1 Tax=Fodinicola feengrottensis TaxID=435914 RepID=UPI0024431A05|nr:hypothetical protein [Fodinicola feengrottensis]
MRAALVFIRTAPARCCRLMTACLIATDAVRAIDVLGRTHPGLAGVDVVASSAGDRAVVVRPHAKVRADPARWPEEVAVLDGGAHPAASRRGHNRVREDAAGRRWLVHADGFWQVHPAAATALSDAVIAEVDPRPGQTALDLYCGVGLFAGALGVQVGRYGKVFAVESDRPAADNARRNLRDVPAVVVSTGGVWGGCVKTRSTSWTRWCLTRPVPALAPRSADSSPR